MQSVPRGFLTGILAQYEPISEAWTGLGLTPTSYSPGKDLVFLWRFRRSRVCTRIACFCVHGAVPL